MAAAAPYRTLDHWRGFAALWVVGFHSFGPWLEARPDLVPAPVAAFIKAGWLGVHVFFVISGYCIASRLEGDFAAERGVTGFWLDRFWRIYPPYWATLGFTAALAIAATPFNGTPIWTADRSVSALPAGAGDGLMVAFALEPWFGHPSYLLVAWTLAYELAFYVLAGLAYVVARRSRRVPLALALGAGLAMAGLAPGMAGLAPVIALWSHFFLGVVVWLLLRMPFSAHRRVIGATGVFGLALLGAALAPADHLTGFVAAAVTAWLLVGLHPLDAALVRQPALGWLGQLGVISYSLYLTHAPVVGRFRNLLGRFWPADRTAAWLVPVAGALLAILVAWLFHRYVESPSERMRQTHRRRSHLPLPPP